MEGPLDRPIHLSSRTMGVKREKKKRKQKSRQLITSFAGLYRLPFYGSATKTLDAHWNQIKLAVGFEAGSGKLGNSNSTLVSHLRTYNRVQLHRTQGSEDTAL